jgi:hypothetical protein
MLLVCVVLSCQYVKANNAIHTTANLFLENVSPLAADTNNELTGSEFDKVLTGFNLPEIELKEGQVVSNVLKVYNNRDEAVKFTVDIVAPSGWKILNDVNEVFESPVGDTIYIPVILVPNKLIEGRTEVIINAFLLDEDSYQIANNYFTLRTVKNTSWNISVEPGNRLYFKNGEKTLDFNYTIQNTGNYQQDIFIENKTIRGDLVILDTNGNELNDPYLNMNLKSRKDTTLYYQASTVIGAERNARSISINSYKPGSNEYYKKYTLYINSSEPSTIGSGSYKQGNKVDFVRLPNEAKVSPYGISTLPLVVEGNVQNVLDENSFMSLNMRGFKQISQDASLAYFAQVNYVRNYYSSEFLDNSPWYIGYFDKKKTLEVGQVNGNVIGINSFGKGVKASYTLSERHKAGAFFTRSPKLFSDLRNEAYGGYYTFTMNDYAKVTARFGRQVSEIGGLNIDSYSLLPSFSLFKKHNIRLIGVATNRSTVGDPTQGYLVGGNYSSIFLKKKLRFSLGSRYNDRNFGSGAFSRFNVNQRSSYTINQKWELYLTNNYQDNTTYNRTTNEELYQQVFFFNNLVFSTVEKKGTYQYGVYYDFRDYLNTEVHSRGLSFRYSTNNYAKNFLATIFTRAGYSMPVGAESGKDFFNFQLSSLVRYRVWNFTARYNLGTLSDAFLYDDRLENTTPQNIRLSVQNQYQFRNEHLLLRSSLVYNYGNTFQNHRVGFFPELFYFSNSGWRFSVNASYNYNSSKYGAVYSDIAAPGNNFDDASRSTNNNVAIGASVRKEFGIPVPFVKKKSGSLYFVSFYDINGNGIKESDEPPIENVVLRVGTDEVLTNKKGEAALKNIPMESFLFNVIPLENEMGWFPNVDDSIQVFGNSVYYVPFVRGVKVYGEVVLERQKIAVADTTKKFDLSRIKITATNDKVYHTLTDIDGKYEFYIPNGDYVISMDEGILGSKYKLSRNNMPVTLKTSQDGVYVSFYIVEKKKKVIIKEF